MKVVQRLAADVVCVLVFSVLGRSSHGEANDLLGVLGTAWPFLAGVVLGTLLARIWRGRFGLRTGTIIWLSAVIFGMVLRILSGETAQPAFIAVATVALGILLLGWRFIVRAIYRAREHAPSSH